MKVLTKEQLREQVVTLRNKLKQARYDLDIAEMHLKQKTKEEN